MKKINIKKLVLAFVLIIVSLFAFSSCENGNPVEDNKDQNATIETEANVTLKAKESYQIDYTVLNGSEANVEYFSEDDEIAEVDEFGEIKAKKDGSTKIIVKVTLMDGTSVSKEINLVVDSETKYKITFQLAGGKCNVEYGEVKAGETYTLPTPTKENAEFVGWTMSGVTGYITEVKDITMNVTVRANWLSYYTVKYNTNGGTYEKESEQVKEGTNIALGIPTKEGNKFLGWGLSKNSSSYVSQLINVNSNCTVYAIWEPAKMDITFDCDGGVYTGPKYVTYGSDLKLGIAHKVGNNFLGWTLTKESTEYITTLSNVKTATTLYAHFEADPNNIDFMVSNLGNDGVPYLSTLQLEFSYSQKTLESGTLTYKSSNESIFTVSATGLITAKKVGVANLTITLKGTQTLTEEVEIVVYVPGYFEVKYETNSYMGVGESVNLITTFIDKIGNKKNVTYQSKDTNIATCTADGKVTGVKEGAATIRVSVVGDESVFFDYKVTVLSASLSNAMKLVLKSHESNVFTRYDLGIGAGTPVYDTDIIGSVSDLLFNDALSINTKYEAVIKNNSNYGGKKSSTEFICVHYTGNMAKGADANANAGYFASTNSSSIHYTTGNDGVYSVLDDSLVGWHAGDGTGTTFKWYATGVKQTSSDPEYPVWGISENSKFTINGKETKCDVPTGTTEATKKVTSDTFVYNGTKQNCINDMGLSWKVVSGEYYMGTTWWCYSQVAAGRICSHGGNNNSIGIESCVNQGSDLWYTWHKTAQLVAKLMKDNSLDIYRVVGHHFFTAKDCPQPMLENDLEIWWKFIEMVQAEYDLLTKYSDTKFSFEIIEGGTSKTGRATQDPNSKIITYKVTITKGGQSESITLYSALNGTYTK